jgi:hypothetical protein
MTAVFSPCGLYRYRLERVFDTGQHTLSVTMLNPSYANDARDDHTIRRLVGFCTALDVRRLIVTNLAALVSPDPKGLSKASDPIGPDNDEAIRSAAGEADIIVVGWGAGVRRLPGRASEVLAILGETSKPIMCWGLTAKREPRHPLMLPSTATLVPLARARHLPLKIPGPRIDDADDRRRWTGVVARGADR